MGRKANWDEKPKSGPGRKARQQPSPYFPGVLSGPGSGGGGISKYKKKKQFGKSSPGRKRTNLPALNDGGRRLKPGMPYRKSSESKKGTKDKQVKRNIKELSESEEEEEEENQIMDSNSEGDEGMSDNDTAEPTIDAGSGSEAEGVEDDILFYLISL